MHTIRAPSGLHGQRSLRTLSLMPELSDDELDALVEEATVDAYGDDEQLDGFAVMIEDNLEVPFETTVLGVTVTVQKNHPRRSPASSPTASATAVTRRSPSSTCRCPSRRREARSGSPPTGTGRGDL